jgi:uncharacterized membrane protein
MKKNGAADLHTDHEHVTRKLERLVFFSDAVFAIAITLLVLDLRLPEGSKAMFDLSQMGTKLFGFALSFAVIGAYWLYHHMRSSLSISRGSGWTYGGPARRLLGWPLD